ncbi:cobalt-zinc-cadmium efflux system membrane fusion protein [Sphingomonas sp. PP-F2F-G114-C0414]|uniref:efflux RND transporter periplasmic adaptor subunit n=1 Tax=Sphingomonas sp. PP-F2F-G114-C0414 TaxID=2135662 RepID=UPI000F23D069|nr:efflux RND transporter periplasmic adaptor subunit [Sphingomonas sp. PP-F2F-G114-C0414]RMB24866.1 cobalt-zinc-cadmium efflux system membrane fusion protein [Sphingomonas sp. PP-F2F-G114-C0414]
MPVFISQLPAGAPVLRSMLLGCLILTVSACGGSQSHEPARQAPIVERKGDRIFVPAGSPLRTRIAVAAVGTSTEGRTLDLPASVEADPALQSKVAPALTGRIVSLRVGLGDHVRAGQPLATMVSSDLAQAYADQARATAAMALATRSKARASALFEAGGGAQKDVLQAENDYATAQADLRSATAKLRIVGAPLRQRGGAQVLTIVAPSSGSVTDLAAARGAVWNDATQSLMTITDLNRVFVTVEVPEKDLASVHVGQPASVRFAAYPDAPVQSRVASVSDVLDPETRRMKVRLAFPDGGRRLKPGMFATVSFQAAAVPAVSVPTGALFLKDEGSQVYVEVAPWTFVPRTVEAGYSLGARTTISKGLKAGERVIVRGGVLIND